MLFPPTGPRSNWRALGLRLSYENRERKPWADRRSGRPTVKRIATSRTARPPDRLTASVKALDIGPRKVGGDDRAVVLTRAGPAHRAPLTEPHTVAPPRPRRDEPADLAAVLRHREREGRAAKQLLGLGPQHRAYLGPGHPHVAVLEHDAQLADPARGRRAGDFDVRDPLQPTPARVHHRGKGPRQYSAQLGAIPFLAPAKPRRELAVVVAPAGLVRDRSQVRLALGGLERLLRARGREATGRMEVGVNQVPAIADHLPAGSAQSGPHLGRLAHDPGIDLVPHIGPGVEALRLPATAVLERERARHHGLREHRLALVGPAGSHFPTDHAGEVTLDRHAVRQGESGGIAHHVQPPAIAPTGRHREPVLGDVHGGAAAAPLAA